MKRYNVNPRYSGGSPAQVDFETAQKVVNDERKHYSIAMSGAYGEKTKNEAESKGLGPFEVEKKGLRSPVEETSEHSNHWLVKCLITGKLFRREFPENKKINSCKKCRYEYDKLMIE